MADYSIISDVSAHIVRMLREKMCPEPIPSPNNIDVSSPAEQDVDYILGLYLYDVREDIQMSSPPYLRTGSNRMVAPAKPLSLYYMLFINGSSQMGLKAHDIQKIIGRAAQIVNDTGIIEPNLLQPWLETKESSIVLSQAVMTLEEKVRVWSAINKPYQISLFYKASPVFLSSQNVIEVQRVASASFSLQLNDGASRGGG